MSKGAIYSTILFRKELDSEKPLALVLIVLLPDDYPVRDFRLERKIQFRQKERLDLIEQYLRK